MNYIALNKLKDFNVIINGTIALTGSLDEEINSNTWGIKLKQSLAQKVTNAELVECLDALLKKKQEQVAEYQVPATFYMWVDEQSFQLHINVITGHTIKLPFGCKINIVKNWEPLIEKFISLSKKGFISWHEITFSDEESEDNDECESYILDVFVVLM